MAVELFMPKMSDHMEAGEVIRWLANEGDGVEEGQPILELLTDKVVAELEAPASGVLRGIRTGVKEGAIVPVGETMAFIAQPDEEVPILPSLVSSPPESRGAPVEAEPSRARATPVARRIARELGVDLSLVTGTGPRGRIREEDVRAFADLVSTAPSTEPAEAGARWSDLTLAQRRTGERMVESVQTVPQFALTINVDMTNALSLRETLMPWIEEEAGERLSITTILVKVVAAALEQYPRANVSFQEGRIKMHRQVNVGVALGTDQGLVVPVIREANKKTLAQITEELASFRDRAREMRLEAEDLSGATFTISNLGMYGVDRFRAVINPPQAAILAVGRMVKMPIGMPDDTIALRPVMSLTLSVDHRAMDGIQGAEFLAEVKKRLEEPFLLL
jgi:pyruvate dehydrogenase E2 component (dihydrolipoamide acetyltransferase)